MQVKEILRVKGNRPIAAEPGGRAVDAIMTMAGQNLDLHQELARLSCA